MGWKWKPPPQPSTTACHEYMTISAGSNLWSFRLYFLVLNFKKNGKLVLEDVYQEIKTEDNINNATTI